MGESSVSILEKLLLEASPAWSIKECRGTAVLLLSGHPSPQLLGSPAHPCPGGPSPAGANSLPCSFSPGVPAEPAGRPGKQIHRQPPQPETSTEQGGNRSGSPPQPCPPVRRAHQSRGLLRPAGMLPTPGPGTVPSPPSTASPGHRPGVGFPPLTNSFLLVHVGSPCGGHCQGWWLSTHH